MFSPIKSSFLFKKLSEEQHTRLMKMAYVCLACIAMQLLFIQYGDFFKKLDLESKLLKDKISLEK